MSYHFFWQGQMSNFHHVDEGIDFMGRKFHTAEQIFMINKAMTFEDGKAFDSLLDTSLTPKEAKAIGRKIKNFNNDVWDLVKYEKMLNAISHKFEIPRFKKMLISTGNNILVEASPYDRIWGIGFSASDAMRNIDYWGENLLGLCLMDLREQLKSN